MATSGNFLTSDSGQGGGNFYGRCIFEWWRTGWGRSGNVGYHNISFNLKTYGGSPTHWQYFYNGSMDVDGAGYGFPSPIQAYGAGATNLSGTQSRTLYTDSAGNRSFYAHAQGGIYTSAINTGGSATWALDNIPMFGGIVSVSPNTNLTDETTSISVDWFKNTGYATLWFRLDNIDNADTTYRIRNVTADPYTWTGFQTWLRQKMVNTNATNLYIYYGDDLNFDGGEDNFNAAWVYPITIKNDTGQANPTFNDFTYLDSNSATVAVTGNNQVLIQRKSTLEATVSTANKATANKNAVMNNYTFTIGGYSQSSPWSNVSNVVKSIGTVSDVSGVQNLTVKAIDSRTNSKAITKSVTILPYNSPAFVPSFIVRYSNNYDSSNGITVESDPGSVIAKVSPLRLSGVDKNSINGTTGVQFDVSKGNNTSYTGTWVNVSASMQALTGNIVAGSISTLANSILTKMNGLGADNTVKWYIKFKVVDKLETTTYEMRLDVGKPIFRIGIDGNVYNNEEKILTERNNLGAHPYRFSAYMSSNQTTVATTFTKINMDTEVYDPNNNFDTTTHGYTAPVAGMYNFTITSMMGSQSANPFLISIGKNSTAEFVRLFEIPNTTGNVTITGTVDLLLNQGDVIYPLYYSVEAGKTLLASYTQNRFSGKLESFIS